MGKDSNKGVLGRFFDLLSGKPEEEDGEQSPGREPTPGLHAPTVEGPKDLLFVQNFTRNGGRFLYCDEAEEVYRFLALIASESGIDKMLCFDPAMQSILHKFGGLTLFSKETEKCDAFFLGCEFLVSFNGGIMISDRQTLERKLEDLPPVFVVLARTSQLTDNLSSGLTGIRMRYAGNLPSQITTIKGPREAEKVEGNAPQACRKEIYLLLLEDQT
jgi:Uncharacterized conserved protein